MDSEEFTESIQEQLGNFVKFENSEHALLWANQFRSDLPTAFSRRLTEELHELNPNETVKTGMSSLKTFLRIWVNLLMLVGFLAKVMFFVLLVWHQWLDKTKVARWTTARS